MLQYVEEGSSLEFVPKSKLTFQQVHFSGLHFLRKGFNNVNKYSKTGMKSRSTVLDSLEDLYSLVPHLSSMADKLYITSAAYFTVVRTFHFMVENPNRFG